MNNENLSFWDSNRESILEAVNKMVSDALYGSCYYSRRNPTVGEKCVNIYRLKNANRLGHIWPKKRDRVFYFCLTVDLFQQIGLKVSLPPDRDVKPRMHNTWRCITVDESKMMEIIQSLADTSSPTNE